MIMHTFCIQVPAFVCGRTYDDFAQSIYYYSTLKPMSEQTHLNPLPPLHPPDILVNYPHIQPSYPIKASATNLRQTSYCTSLTPSLLYRTLTLRHKLHVSNSSQQLGRPVLRHFWRFRS